MGTKHQKTTHRLAIHWPNHIASFPYWCRIKPLPDRNRRKKARKMFETLKTFTLALDLRGTIRINVIRTREH